MGREVEGLTVRGGWFYYRGAQVGGVRPTRVALKTRDEEEAIRKIWVIRKNPVSAAAAVTGFAAAATRYLDHQKGLRRHTPKTTHVTAAVLKQFGDWAGNRRVGEITAEQVAEWQAYLGNQPGVRKGSKMASSSITSHLMRLKGFFRWAVEARMISQSPMEKTKLGKPKATRRNLWWDRDTREKMLALAAKEKNEKVQFILHVGFFAGLRPGEMLAMTPEWIDMRGGQLHVQEVRMNGTTVWRPKDKEVRTIPLHPRLKAFLKKYGMKRPWMLAQKRTKMPAAPAVRYDARAAFYRVVKMAGASGSLNTLRHSFASQLVLGGASLSEVAALLGNSLRVCEEHYAGLTARGRAVVLKLG
ncbi:MAG: tyrosine-type recombinase/integrase [Verrucomicrobiota bacterium]